MLVQLKNCQSKYQDPGSIVRILSPKVQARKNIQRKLTLKNYKKKRYKKENILSLMINKKEPEKYRQLASMMFKLIILKK